MSSKASVDVASGAKQSLMAGRLTAADYEVEYPFEDTAQSGGEENKIRGNWASKMDSLLSCVGFLVNYRHLWVLPSLASSHGGIVFFIPYTVMLMFVAVPFILIEYALGQFSSLGCIAVWKVCPLFQGIGISMFLLSALVSIQHNVVIAWTLHYLISSMRSRVAWADCSHSWNIPGCTSGDLGAGRPCSDNNDNSTQLCTYANVTVSNMSAEEVAASLPSEQYFLREMLEQSSGVDDFGTMLWQLGLYLLAGWLIQFFCLFSHVKSAGKVAYVTTTLPLIVMLVLFVKCLTEQGGFDGFTSMFKGDWAQLMDYRVWGDAGLQAFFSLTCCWGTFITLSSYNRFHNDCFKDVLFICCCDLLCSLFVCFVTYSVCGVLAQELNEVIEVLIVRGPRLIFIVFAEAVARFPIAPVWAVLYFLMVIMVGISTQIFLTANVVTSLCDQFARTLRRNQRHVLSLVSVFFFVAGLFLCTKAGMYYFVFLEYFATTWSVLTIAFFESMALSWVYGIDNVLDNVKWMTGYFPPFYIFWKVHLKFVVPLITLALVLFSGVEFRVLQYEGYVYPEWLHWIGWSISLMPLAVIVLTGVLKFFTTSGPCVKRFRDLMIPQDDWGPALAVHRAEEFPLQIPEAREPVKGVADIRTLLLSRLDEEKDDGEMDALNGSYINRLDRIDRETAI